MQLDLYPSMDGYIGRIVLPSEFQFPKKSSDLPEFVCVLDVSGSMGQQVPRLVTRLIPQLLEILGYSHTDTVHLVQFSSTASTVKYRIPTLQKSTMKAGGGTYMAPAINELGLCLKQLPRKEVRVLALSDGEIADQEHTMQAASLLAREMSSLGYMVNAQAVRLFTSSSEPDTRGLASIMQLSTIPTNLVDLDYHLPDDEILSTIMSLFFDDRLNNTVRLTCDQKVIVQSPWVKTGNEFTTLRLGENTLWFTDVPTNVKVEGIDGLIPVVMGPRLTPANFEAMLRPKFDEFMTYLKVLKVVNSVHSRQEIEDMMSYVTRFQDFLAAMDPDLQAPLEQATSLRGRVEFFRRTIERRKRSFLEQMRLIANDDKVSKLNSAQQANYLRQMDVTTNSKALARRALVTGIDFTAQVHKEVREMRTHLGELSGISDEHHTVSFYSQDTTLGGIKAVCDLVDQELLDDMEATDILQLLNLVGVACRSPVGNFVDPMTWRVEDLFPGCFCSVSDITIATIQGAAQGGVLHAPGMGSEAVINNVIPFFDDEKIHTFLLKYAPGLLEYAASIGMRRVLAEVPKTHAYTIGAGAWKMVQILNKNKSELNVKSFTCMVKGYVSALKGSFDYVLDLFVPQADPTRVFFINNNGITNMLAPMVHVCTEGAVHTAHSSKRSKRDRDADRGTVDRAQFLPEVLRSIYNFEVYQVMRRFLKTSDQPDIYAIQTLTKLLGVDLATHRSPVGEFFEVPPPVTHYDQYNIDEELYSQFEKMMWYVDYLTLLPDMVKCVGQSNPVEYMASLPQMSPATICKALGIDDWGESPEISLRKFKLYNMAQGLTYRNKQDRLDDEKKVMLIADIGIRQEGETFLRDYVRAQFANQYRSDMTHKKQDEKKMLVDKLVTGLLKTPSMKDFMKYLQDGLTKGECHVQIESIASLGYQQLKLGLVESEEDSVPRRMDKIKCVVLSRRPDDPEVVLWNKGKSLIGPQCEPFRQCIVKTLGPDEWTTFEQVTRQYACHSYREGVCNRHTHCNQRPSYFAQGYATLLDFQRAAPQEWEAYQMEHYHCCGVPQLAGIITRRSERARLKAQGNPFVKNCKDQGKK